ncbi:unnamed protein product [Leptidea sinapis]|uniref:Uncharacterized protein n=1 Tax=Leptidea sinapis TaxID=189913 RepID=A0A5E4PNA3_9NEOP|nr:unnamed protein product [Leptidea sinapis]
MELLLLPNSPYLSFVW